MNKWGRVLAAILWGGAVESVSGAAPGFYFAAALIASYLFLNLPFVLSLLNAAVAISVAFLVVLFWAWSITEWMGISFGYAAHLAVYFSVLFIIFILKYDR